MLNSKNGLWLCWDYSINRIPQQHSGCVEKTLQRICSCSNLLEFLCNNQTHYAANDQLCTSQALFISPFSWETWIPSSRHSRCPFWPCKCPFSRAQCDAARRRGLTLRCGWAAPCTKQMNPSQILSVIPCLIPRTTNPWTWFLTDQCIHCSSQPVHIPAPYWTGPQPGNAERPLSSANPSPTVNKSSTLCCICFRLFVCAGPHGLRATCERTCLKRTTTSSAARIWLTSKRAFGHTVKGFMHFLMFMQSTKGSNALPKFTVWLMA